MSRRLWEGLRGWRSKERDEYTLGVLSPSVGGEGYNSLGNAVSVVRVHAMHEGCDEDEAGSSGHFLVNCDRESSVVMTGLSLGPRGSGAVNTVAAWEPVVREPTAGT